VGITNISALDLLSASHLIRFFNIFKSQIQSTKLQINLKFQYSMTKTFSAGVAFRCTNLCSPVIVPFCINACGAPVWSFGFGSLGFVCYLVLENWKL
jgi:hypothetical protein